MHSSPFTRFRYVYICSPHTPLALSAFQKWNGHFFEGTTLTALGLVVQFGHHTCSDPSPLQDLMVFDLSGVHRLVIRYCGCGDSVSKYTQLLRARLFPATTERPSTAFSFNLLDFFHKLQSQNKCNLYDFYHTIIQRADAAGLDSEIVGPLVPAPRSLTHPYPVSIQRDHVGVSHLESPPAPQTSRFCPSLQQHPVHTERECRNRLSCLPTARKEYHQFLRRSAV